MTENVRDTRAIPGGVRLVLAARKPAEAASRLRKTLGCQVALRQARPDQPPPCPFMDQGVRFLVRARGARVMVDLVVSDDRIGPGVLRERVETAVGGRSPPVSR